MSKAAEETESVEPKPKHLVDHLYVKRGDEPVKKIANTTEEISAHLYQGYHQVDRTGNELSASKEAGE